MLRDANTLLANATAITGSALGPNVWDAGGANRNLGAGTPLYLVSQVTTTFDDSGNNSQLTILWQTSANENMAGPTNTVIDFFDTNSTANTIHIRVIPPGAVTARYNALYWSVAGGNFANGALTSFVTPDPQSWVPAAKGFTGPTFA